MAEDDEYPDELPPPEESLSDQMVESDEDLVNGLEERLLEGDDSVSGQPVEVLTGDGQVVVMPGADCVRCGSPSSGVVVVVGDVTRWSGGQANPYCDDCRSAMFPEGMTSGFEWREY